MDNRAIDAKYRTTLVCIDSYHDKIMKGRIENPFIDGSIEFSGLMSFLLTMEGLLEQMKYPQAYEIKRTFMEESGYQYRIGQHNQENKGKKGTFTLKILFRQNASWQGFVLWEERGLKKSFRSVLELLILMNSALEES